MCKQIIQICNALIQLNWLNAIIDNEKYNCGQLMLQKSKDN